MSEVRFWDHEHNCWAFGESIWDGRASLIGERASLPQNGQRAYQKGELASPRDVANKSPEGEGQWSWGGRRNAA